MSKKIILLVIASIIGLLALSLVQAKLIQNTYQLRKEALIDRNSEILGKIGSYGTTIDSISDAISITFFKDLDGYSLQKLSKEKLMNRLRVINDSLNPLFISAYENVINAKHLKFDLKYHKMLQSIVLIDSLKTDTIFFDKKSKNFKLIGYDFENDDELRLGTSTWETNRTFDKKINGVLKKGSYDVVFKTINYMNMDQANTIILTEMKGLLVTSCCIFLFVIGLFYYSIKNLITQKKIADIKTDFINNITHELKTPLTTLSLATKMLKQQNKNVENKMFIATLGTIERQNVRLQKLIDQVLNNSLGYKEIVLKKENVSLNQFIHTVLDDFEISNTNTIVIQRNICIKNQELSIDRFYISTALLNILENAVKYGATTIIFFLKRTNNIELSIQDNGIGIAKKDLQSIFTKFYRVDNQNIHNVKGLGLGLYYSNQVVKAHDGKIHVESEKDKGTNFTIILPIN